MATLVVVHHPDKFPRYLEDKSLSWKAVGIMAYIMRKGNQENIRLFDEIPRESSDSSRTAVASALKELKAKRYYVKIQTKKKTKDDNKVHFYHLFSSRPSRKPISDNDLSMFRELLRRQPKSIVHVHYLAKSLFSGAMTFIHNNLITNPILIRSNSFLLRKKELTRPPVARASLYRSLSGVDKKNVDRLFQLWCDKIKNHSAKKASKTYQESLEALSRKYLSLNKKGKNKPGYYILRESINTYAALISDNSVAFHKYRTTPWHVGLNEFFRFGSYTRKHLRGKEYDGAYGRALDNIMQARGWFSECRRGLDYCLNKYGSFKKAKHPEVAEAVEEFFLGMGAGMGEAAAKKYSARAADNFMQWWEEAKGKLRTADPMDEKYPLRFLKRHIFKMIDNNYIRKGKDIELRWLTERFFTKEVKSYLEQMHIWQKPGPRLY
jgi:hypothetical protein